MYTLTMQDGPPFMVIITNSQDVVFSCDYRHLSITETGTPGDDLVFTFHSSASQLTVAAEDISISSFSTYRASEMLSAIADAIK